MGGVASGFQAGDNVFLGVTDLEIIQKKQRFHGGWNSKMAECLNGPCKFVQSIGGDAMVKAQSGNVYRLNTELLVKFKSTPCSESPEITNLVTDETFKTLMITDVSLMKRFQNEQGGVWNDEMTEIVGKEVEIIQNTTRESVKIKYNDKYYVVNSQCIVQKPFDRLTITSKTLRKPIVFKEGDKVKLIGNAEEMKVLQENHGSWSELMSLIVGEEVEIVKLFEDGDCYISNNGMEWLINQKCFVEPNIPNNIIKDISSKSGEFTRSESIKLFMALKKGDLQLIDKLVDIVGVNNKAYENMSPLMVASNEGLTEVVQLLLDKKAEINLTDENGNTALHIAVMKNHIKICQLLIEAGTDLNHQNNQMLTPIMISVVEKFHHILQLLVDRPHADLNVGDVDNDTAMHLAIEKDIIESVEILLKAGSDIKRVNSKNFSSFHLAVVQGNQKIVEMFLKNEGDDIVNSQKKDKFAAIHLAALNNHSEVLKVLLKHNADVNIRNSKLQTALHIAVSQRYMNCVKVLVENNADVNLKDEIGDTPVLDGIRIHNMNCMRRFGSLCGISDMLNLMEGFQRGTDNPENIILYLVEHGAKLDIENNAGKNSISICENEELKSKLLKNSILKNQESKCNETSDKKKLQKMQDLVRKLIDENSILLNQESKYNETSDNEELEKMRDLVRKLKDEKTCVICKDIKANITFNCGHMSCNICAKNLLECHMCRRLITQRIQTFY